MAELRNLTPHVVNLRAASGEMLTIEPTGLARCSQTVQQVVEVVVGRDTIVLSHVELGEVEGLPDPQNGVFLIVSRPVAEKMRGLRSDLVVPGIPIRDEKGRVIGCDGLSVI